MQTNVEQFVAITLVFLLAGAVKGVVGMGLPTVAMGLLGLLLPVPVAASLITIPSFVTNAWQMFRGSHARALVRRLWPLLLGTAIGIAAGAHLMSSWASSARSFLGAVLIGYAAIGLSGLRLPAPPARMERWLSLAAGALTGVLTAATGVFVVPAVPYLSSLALEKKELSQAMGMSFTVSTVALALNLSAAHHVNAETLVASSFMLIPATAGMWIGQQVQAAIPERTFRRVFFGAVLVLGATLLT